MNEVSQPLQDHLQAVWQSTARELAVAFLRRAVTADMSLADLVKALSFQAVQSELGDIRLRDIVPASARPVTKLDPHGAVKVARGGKRAKGKRRHRGMQVIQEMKLLVLRRAGANGATSPELGECLKKAGHHTDPGMTYQLLRSMETAGLLKSEGDRPKTWRLTPQGWSLLQK